MDHPVVAGISAVVGVCLLAGAMRANASEQTDRPSPFVFELKPAKALSSRPISPLIYGNFMEFVGHQVDRVWGQLLNNRSFEEVPPYRGDNWSALEIRPQDYSSALPWWHNGYEANPWFSYSRNTRDLVTTETHWGFYHGKSGGSASDQGTSPWGIGQNGLYLKRDAAYRFRGFLAHDFGKHGDSRRVTVKLVAESDESRVIDSAEFEIGTAFTECKATLKSGDFAGRAGRRVEARWPGRLFADCFELYPADAMNGWRKDVVDIVRQVHPSILRFPGGCYASFYNWRDAIGLRDSRIPLPNEFWGGLEDNDVGTDEYLDLCELLHCEPMLCVNILTGTPNLAAEWVEYCNGSAKSPMGKLRAAYGHAIPRRVTYWELDNETGRKFDVEQYGAKVIEFAKAMKAVDSSIKLIVVGYDNSGNDWERLLEICGSHIDLVCDRDHSEPTLAQHTATLVAYREKTGRRIGMCNTEWTAPLDLPPGTSDAQAIADQNIRLRWQQWCAGLNTAAVLQSYWRNAEWMDLSNFNGFVNQHGANSAEASKSGAWVSACGKVLGFIAASEAAWPVEVSPTQHEDRIHVAAAWSKSKDCLVISIVNIGEATSVQIALAPTAKARTLKSTRGIVAPSLTSRNTETEPNTVKPVTPKASIVDGGLAIDIPAYSVSEVVVTE